MGKPLASFGLLALLLGLTSAGVAAAQAAPSPWPGVRALQPGSQVEVILLNFQTLRGQFEQASDNSLTLRLPGGARTLARTEIGRVSLRRGHRLRNAALGAGVGGGGGAAVGAALGHGGFAGAFSAVMGGLGAILGAGVGSLLPASGFQTVYRVAPHPPPGH